LSQQTDIFFQFTTQIQKQLNLPQSKPRNFQKNEFLFLTQNFPETFKFVKNQEERAKIHKQLFLIQKKVYENNHVLKSNDQFDFSVFFKKIQAHILQIKNLEKNQKQK
jgi:hypothetical protein